MRKIFFLCAAVVALTANAEITTLDLSTATDFDNFDPVVYDKTDATKVYTGSLQDVWEGTVSNLPKYTRRSSTGKCRLSGTVSAIPCKDNASNNYSVCNTCNTKEAV